MNTELEEKRDVLETTCILLTILQWLSPLLAICILFLLSVFVAPPFADYYARHREMVYHSHPEYAHSSIYEFHNISVPFGSDRDCSKSHRIKSYPYLKHLKQRLVFPEYITPEVRQELGIPNSCNRDRKNRTHLQVEQLKVEYLLDRAYILTWQGKGENGQIIDIKREPFSDEEKAQTFINKFTFVKMLEELLLHPYPPSILVYTIALIHLIGRYKERLKRKLQSYVQITD